jgi:predicted TIM-barrel fold metal-dependent hydrolase
MDRTTAASHSAAFASASHPRRTFLSGVAGLGINLCTRSGLHAQAAAPAHTIDVHHHLFAPDYRAAIAAIGAGGAPRWSPEQSLAEMEKSRVQTALLSLAPPGLWFGDAAQARKLARMVNDYGAKLAKDYPGRFGLFAALPLPDAEGSLREIEYAYDTLHAEGIGLMTSYGDKWLGDASFAPIWAELNRRKAVIYTHPNTPVCCGKLNDDVPSGVIELAVDTTRTMASLLFSGTAARYPDIRWILSHGGGTTPFLLSRFTRQEEEMKEHEKRLPNGLLYELKKFYYETAQANHPGALDALLRIVPLSQVLFGTDYPYRVGADVNAGLAAYHFSPQDVLAIERENTLRILPQLKR